jgi:hypothetical protein
VKSRNKLPKKGLLDFHQEVSPTFDLIATHKHLAAANSHRSGQSGIGNL